MSEIKNLGFIGLGVMGGAMCANLVRTAGLPVMAFDPVATALDTAVDAGAMRAGDVAEIASHSDVVFLSLPTIDHVESVVNELLASTKRPAFIVDMSTSDVARTRALGERLTCEGVTLVDAPVARLRQAAKDGTLLITVGSSEADFGLIEPFLKCMGSDIIHAGELGGGQVIKILNNMVVFQTFNALAEAVAIGKAAGVDAKLLLETLTLGSADSFVLRKSALSTLAVDSFPTKTFPTTYAIKDLNLALQLAETSGVDALSAQATMSLLQATLEAGYAEQYYPVMVKLLEKSPVPA